jgi:hypothetical protein
MERPPLRAAGEEEVNVSMTCGIIMNRAREKGLAPNPSITYPTSTSNANHDLLNVSAPFGSHAL